MSQNKPATEDNHQQPLKGIALPPKRFQETLPDEWLAKLTGWGYEALALQNDPTLPRTGSEKDPRDGLYRLHFLYDLGTETPRQASLDYFQKASEKARKHGLKCYLYCWEPAVPTAVWEELPEHWKAWNGGKPSPMNIDMACEEAAEWYWALVRRAVERLPCVDGLILGREDNGACLHAPRDPLANAPSKAGRWAAFYRTFDEVLKQTRSDLEMILYDWWWDAGDHETILDHLPEKVRMITRLENNTKNFAHPIFTQYESMLNDVSFEVDRPINEAQGILESYRKRGMDFYGMIALLGGIEVFMLPYAHTPRMYFRKLRGFQKEEFAGWMDYDCGGIDTGLTADVLEIFHSHENASTEACVSALLRHRYDASDRIEEDLATAFRHFENAIELIPNDLFTRSNRMLNAFGYVAHLCIGLPIRPGDAWQGRADWERPDGRSPTDPHNYTEPRSLERILSRLPLVITEQREGLERIRSTTKHEGQAEAMENRRYDASMAEAFWRILRAAYHFYAMAGLLQKIRRDNRMIPADRQTLDYLRDEEIRNTEAFAELVRQHPEFYTNSTHDGWRYLTIEDPRLPYGPAALEQKCEILRKIDWEAEVRALSPTVAIKWNVGKWRGYYFP